MSAKGSDSELVGKKVFFLYPTAVVQNRIIDELVQQEYEIYIARDKDTLRRVLRKYPDSIVFIDVNEKLSEKEWEVWVRAVMEAPDTKNVSIGIVTAYDDAAIKQKYLNILKIKCGYTVLRFELDKAIKQIYDALNSVDAKGRRKYIRANTSQEANTTLNLPLNGSYIKGQIKDISVVGLSCSIEGNPDLPKNALFNDIQVKLHTTLLKVEGVVLGSRMDGKDRIYVLIFSQRVDHDVRAKIRKFIQHNLQAKMDPELK